MNYKYQFKLEKFLSFIIYQQIPIMTILDVFIIGVKCAKNDQKR